MTEKLLTVEGLTKEYSTSQGAIKAVDDVSFEVERGEIVGLLGPNGAGKTTTIKSILGLVSPTEGRISVRDVDPTEDPRAVYRNVSAVLEGARNVYWRLTPRENVRFFAGLQGQLPAETEEMRDGLLAKLGLESKGDDPVRDLSRGMKQRVSIACALVRDTPVIFLDEPTLGLDVESSRNLRTELHRLVEQENRTIIISSHDMDVIQAVCDRVIIMNEGSVLVDDPIDELMSLFTVQGYRAVIDRPLDEETLDPFDVEWQRRDGESATFEVVLPEKDDLYDLMATLDDAGVSVDKLETIEPDLEEVFVKITNQKTIPEISA